MKGPGGYYNAGNLLGLTISVAAQFAGSGLVGASLADQFVGSAGAIAMLCATVIFLCSGEIYHRAWSLEGGSDPRLIRVGDLVSGMGALTLSVALLAFGHPALAAATALLQGLGKFGSGLQASARPSSWWPASWPDPFRSAVVAGRVPAVLAAGFDLWTASGHTDAGFRFSAMLMPATLLVCQALWIKADLLLLHGEAGTRADLLAGAANGRPERAHAVRSDGTPATAPSIERERNRART